MSEEKIRKLIVSEDRFKELLITELKSRLISKHNLVNSIEFSLTAQSDEIYQKEYDAIMKTNYAEKEFDK